MIRKKKVRKRLMAWTSVFCLMLCFAPITAFAETGAGDDTELEEVIEEILIESVSDNTETAEPEDDEEISPDDATVNIVVGALMNEETESMDEDDDADEEEFISTAFSVPGNGSVLDDVTDDSTKEFFTITTENDNTFFLVIDRSGTSENVYLLSMVDETDLEDFVITTDEETVTQESGVVLDESSTNDVVEEADEEENSETDDQNSSSGGILLLIVIAVVGCGGAYYYFRVRKPKQGAEGSDSENMEYGDESFQTENEDAGSDDADDSYGD